MSFALKSVNLKIDRRYGIKLLKMASDLIEHKNDQDYFSISLGIYTKCHTLEKSLKPGPTPDEFEVYRLAEKIWPYALEEYERCVGY